jgi:uncharacterized membrane protein SpoIIM required for sporulation/ABC-type transport system involved in multi-copper enzyme maturation permease subunit
MSTISKTQPQPPANASESNLQQEAVGFGDKATLWQSFQNAMVITRREVRDSFRDWRIMAPIVILTLCFPALANIASAAFINLFEDYGADGREITEAFLPLMPMIVGFFPVSISLVIALETFVGEKERRSLEPLLSTPLTNTELYAGKVLAATLPPLMAAYLGISIYIGGLIIGAQQWRPDPILVLMILTLTTVQAIVMVTGAVVISSQTTSTRAANLLASVIILPMSILIIIESLLMVQPDRRFVLWWICFGLMIVIVLLVRTGARIFNREELLGRAVDALDLKWAGRVFWDQVRGITHEERDAHENRGEPLPALNGPLHWYRRSVFPVFGRLRSSMATISIALLAAFIGGWYSASAYTLPLDRQPPDTSPDPIAAFDTAIETRLFTESAVPYTVQPPPEDTGGDVTTIDLFAAWDSTLGSASGVEATAASPPWNYSDEALLNNLRDLWESAASDPAVIGLALTQNLRVLAVAFVLGMFTFGVLSTLLVMLPFGILGYVFGNIALNGISVVPFIMAIIPHGIVEVPAILIAGALILHAASSITGEMKKLTVGEVWLRAVGDAFKLYFAIVVPLLIIAATLEVMVTPRMVEMALEIGF